MANMFCGFACGIWLLGLGIKQCFLHTGPETDHGMGQKMKRA